MDEHQPNQEWQETEQAYVLKKQKQIHLLILNNYVNCYHYYGIKNIFKTLQQGYSGDDTRLATSRFL